MKTWEKLAVRAALVATTLTAALLFGGCVSSSSRTWAQTAPTIEPDHPGINAVHLGSWSDGRDRVN